MHRVLIAAAAVMLLVMSFATLTAEASSSLTTRLGTHGAAKLTTGGPNSLYVNLKGLTDGRWAEALYAGTCARLGVRIVALPALVVYAGLAKRTNTLTAGQALAARLGVIRIARGSTSYCASFRPGSVPVPTPTPTPTPTPGADVCTPTVALACIGEQRSYFTSDGAQGIVTVERAELVGGSEHVLVKITTTAGRDMTFAWQVGDTRAPTGTMYGRQGIGERSPGFPTFADASGVAEGWMVFYVFPDIKPFLVTPAGNVRLY
jgi:hypothetical protein